MIQQYDPLAVFQQPENKAGICEIKQFAVQVAAGTPVTVLVSPVTGKKIRLLSLQVFAETADTAFNLQSDPGGGGTIIFKGWAIFENDKYISQPVIGIVDTATSNGLSVGTAAGGSTDYFGRYIEVTP